MIVWIRGHVLFFIVGGGGGAALTGHPLVIVATTNVDLYNRSCPLSRRQRNPFLGLAGIRRGVAGELVL
jgi:hypothetical protein